MVTYRQTLARQRRTRRLAAKWKPCRCEGLHYGCEQCQACHGKRPNCAVCKGEGSVVLRAL